MPPQKKSATPSKKAKKRKRGVFKTLFFYLSLTLLLYLFIFGCGCLFYYLRSESFNLHDVTKLPARSIIYASDQKTELSTMHGANRRLQKIDDISPWFIQALLAREDIRFHKHFGVDLRGLVRAFYRTLFHSKKEGGSTITMQLVDNSFKYNGKSLDGKFLELALAIRLERKFEKEQILELYINNIFWGHTIRGIESASRTYFGKSSTQLSLAESALLAGIIRGPNKFSPFVNFDAALQQKNTTLKRMHHYNLITKSQLDRVLEEKIKLRPESKRRSYSSYAVDAIRRDLDSILEKHDIKMGGLVVQTTIDVKLQKHAEIALNKHLERIESSPSYKHQTRKEYLGSSKKKSPEYIQGALVCIQNNSGEVKAIVGGRNFEESKFNRAVSAKRQIGSIFKPFVYLAATQKGLLPTTWISDAPLRNNEIRSAPKNWFPKNSDGKFYKHVLVQDALIHSRNTSSIRVGNFASIKNVLNIAKQVGFHQKIPPFASSFLGSFEATPWQVAQSYSIFPNQGKIARPYLIKKIIDRHGNTIYSDSGTIRVNTGIKKGAVQLTSKVMEKIPIYGTAKSLFNKYQFKEPVMGKTGTTDHYHDAWFAGSTSSLTCAVWVGMDNNSTTINRGYGSTLALPIWHDVIQHSKKLKYPTLSFPEISNKKRVVICSHSSQLATLRCQKGKSAYQIDIPSDCIPKHSCDIHPARALVDLSPTIPRSVRNTSSSKNSRKAFNSKYSKAVVDRPTKAIRVNVSKAIVDKPVKAVRVNISKAIVDRPVKAVKISKAIPQPSPPPRAVPN